MQKSILIIDDHADIREMYSSVLTTKGYTVCSEEDGLNGVKRAVECKPDIILLDIMMPKMDGFTVLDTLKNNPQITGKIIVISNLENAGDVEHALSSGAYKFLRKSEYTPEQIAEEIAIALT